MTFNPIQVYPDPLADAVVLGLLWGLFSIATVLRRRTTSERLRRQLLIVGWILAIGASALTIRSLGILVRHTEVLGLGGIWFGVAGLVAFAAVITYRVAARSQAGGR